MEGTDLIQAGAQVSAELARGAGLRQPDRHPATGDSAASFSNCQPVHNWGVSLTAPSTASAWWNYGIRRGAAIATSARSIERHLNWQPRRAVDLSGE